MNINTLIHEVHEDITMILMMIVITLVTDQSMCKAMIVMMI